MRVLLVLYVIMIAAVLATYLTIGVIAR